MKLCILVYFTFLSDGEAPRRRGAWGSLPSYPTLSTGLTGVCTASGVTGLNKLGKLGKGETRNLSFRQTAPYFQRSRYRELILPLNFHQNTKFSAPDFDVFLEKIIRQKTIIRRLI